MIECAHAKPVRQTERNMIAVCQGTKSKNDMIVEAVEQYKDMFVRARANFAKVTERSQTYRRRWETGRRRKQWERRTSTWRK